MSARLRPRVMLSTNFGRRVEIWTEPGLPGAYICHMGRLFSHMLGTAGMLLTMLLWLSLLTPRKADHLVDSLAGSQNEYRIVLGAALLSTVLSFVAAIRGSKWWYIGIALSSGTLAFFTYTLSVYPTG